MPPSGSRSTGRVCLCAGAASVLLHGLVVVLWREPVSPPVQRSRAQPVLIGITLPEVAAPTPLPRPAPPLATRAAAVAPIVDPTASEQTAPLETTTPVSSLRPGLRDARLFVAPRDLPPPEERSLETRFADALRVRQDSLEAETRRARDARALRIGRWTIPLLGDLDTYRDPEWDAIRAQEADRERWEAMRERERENRRRRRHR